MNEFIFDGFIEELEKIAVSRNFIRSGKGQMRGAGKGEGMLGGLRRNKMKKPCPTGGPGNAKGKGQGKGKNR